MTPDGEPLRGGTANAGRVVRFGDTVRRPRGAHTPAVHDLLRHLRTRGFAGAPAVLGLDDQHELLEYVPGTAAVEPPARWARTDDALDGVGALLRRLHDAADGFDGAGRAWQRAVPRRWTGPLVTHNDVNPGNVIFRNGRPVALIDFDLAAPGCRAWDLAVTACCWAPLRDPQDVPDERVEQPWHRVRVLLEGYRASAEVRAATAEACADANGWIADVIREASERGHPAFGRMWQAQGRLYARAGTWLEAHRAELAAAVRD